MGFVLDGLLKKNLIESPVTVNTDFTTEVIDIDNREDAFSIQIEYANGNGSVDMDFIYELSLDGINFVPVDDEKFTILDDSGTAVWDIADTGTSFLRVAVVVRDGSLDLTDIHYSAKRRH